MWLTVDAAMTLPLKPGCLRMSAEQSAVFFPGCREKRVLWDQFHSLRYPPGYLPRDALEVRPHVSYNSFHTA